MRANRVDKNQPDLVREVRQAGVVWVYTGGDPKIGFDGLMCFKGRAVPTD